MSLRGNQLRTAAVCGSLLSLLLVNSLSVHFAVAQSTPSSSMSHDRSGKATAHASTSKTVPAAAKNADKGDTATSEAASQAQTLLKGRCFSCHGADSQQARLRLDTRDALLKGGVSGAAIVAGKGKDSLLLKRILGQGGTRMPLGFAPLNAQETAVIRAWIDSGAAWPGGNAKHWAYLPPKPVTPPAAHLKAYQHWPRNPIDNFVLARLVKENLTPAPPAPKETLLRRVTLDLTGLPPTVEETQAFLADAGKDAYEKVVDRLLASPRYGERQARPWLDLARYADTNGYEKDSRRTMWPYRDWVINAFNSDMPYDQFTIEQMAGDLLPNPTPSQIIATGFHRNTMYNDEGGVDREEQRWLTIVDRVGTTASVWMGTTLMCAQCHNHKYDPFTQKDYYSFFAFFERAKEEEFKVSVDKDGKPTVTTLVMQEKPEAAPPTTFVRIKGAFLSKGEQVSAHTPAILPPMPADAPVNRLGLARWLVAPENPLTARVTVNRCWEQLFGAGLVETTEDFGAQGRRPTHPELLDWLAGAFTAKAEVSNSSSSFSLLPSAFPCNWSMKKLLRLMVTSATYRQSSRMTPTLLARDPANRLLARGPRFRMEAEMLRDMALSASGLLSAKIGGPSVFPSQPDGIWNNPYSGDQWKESEGEDRYRRGLYTFWRRTSPYPAFTTFDASSREFCTLRRLRTNTPLQALTTLNDPAFFEAARALAQRMQEGGADLNKQLTVGYLRCLSRRPQPGELSRLTLLYNQELARFAAHPEQAQKLAGEKATPSLAALTIVANVLLNLDETLNKE
jgi:hypothetical protein